MYSNFPILESGSCGFHFLMLQWQPMLYVNRLLWSGINGVVLCCVLALSTIAAPDPTLLERFLAYDSLVIANGAAEQATEAAFKVSERLTQCRDAGGEDQAVEECVLRAIFGNGTLRPVARSVEPTESTMTSVVIEGRGSCAALVAMVLGLTASVGAPFNAVILRDHVLLVSKSSPAVHYEALEGGRRLDPGELSRNRPSPPGGPIQVSGEGFLPYYLDNLAARFAEADDGATAERLFREALDLGPGTARVHYNYGTFLLRQERAEDADGHLSQAIRLGWRDAAAYVNRGVARWKLGRIKAARRDFERALKLDPANRDARANLRKIAL